MKKCHLKNQNIDVLGHNNSEKRIRPLDKILKTIMEFPTPMKMKDVWSFLGAALYYRTFIHRFSDSAKPLIDLTKKTNSEKRTFRWSEQHEVAFQQLKDVLTTPPVLGKSLYLVMLVDTR